MSGTQGPSAPTDSTRQGTSPAQGSHSLVIQMVGRQAQMYQGTVVLHASRSPGARSSRHLILLPPSPQNRPLCSPQGLPESMGQHLEVSLSTPGNTRLSPRQLSLPRYAILPPCPGCWDMHTLVRYAATGSMRPGPCGSATTQLSSRFRRVLAGRLSSALASAAGPRAL